MRLGMSSENTLRSLMSAGMYEAYIRMSLSEAITEIEDDTTPKDSGVTTNTGNVQTQKDIMKEVILLGGLIMQRAIIYTPVDKGNLVSSIYMKQVGAGVMIGYNCDYAIFVHEVGFNYHKPPTQYKFLEEAAFEIAMEDEVQYRVSITYDPLAVYVNVEGTGSDLVSIKATERVNRLTSRKTKILNAFLNFDKDTASIEDNLYQSKMEQFFDFYRGMGHNDWSIVDEWQDRNRHT